MTVCYGFSPLELAGSHFPFPPCEKTGQVFLLKIKNKSKRYMMRHDGTQWEQKLMRNGANLIVQKLRMFLAKETLRRMKQIQN